MRIQSDDDLVAIDRAYFRRQAQEALSIFVAPLSGLVNAVVPHRRRSADDVSAADDL